MRSNKGFGRTWARRWRLREEKARAEEKSKRTAPVYTRDTLKLETGAIGKPVEQKQKIVIMSMEVNTLLRDLGCKRATGRIRRRFAEMLRFDRRDTWT